MHPAEDHDFYTELIRDEICRQKLTAGELLRQWGINNKIPIEPATTHPNIILKTTPLIIEQRWGTESFQLHYSCGTLWVVEREAKWVIIFSFLPNHRPQYTRHDWKQSLINWSNLKLNMNQNTTESHVIAKNIQNICILVVSASSLMLRHKHGRLDRDTFQIQCSLELTH